MSYIHSDRPLVKMRDSKGTDCKFDVSAPILPPMNQHPANVLFICSGNAGRSIMAESILRSLGGPDFNAFSAGSHPTGRVNPMAILELQRRGYPIHGLESKSWSKFVSDDAPALDFVITVCAKAAQEAMPQWKGSPQRLAWHFARPVRPRVRTSRSAWRFPMCARPSKWRYRILFRLIRKGPAIRQRS